MPERPLILITNDDGIDSPGLRALERPLARLGEVWVVAPSRERSTSSHSLSLGGPVLLTRCGPRRWSVGGTPADATFVAVFSVLPRRPALVVSGINCGPNLGTDVIYSGTVAAAREAAMRGIPAMAVSLTGGRTYGRAASVAVRVARSLLAERLPRTRDGRGLLVNVNVPPRSAGRIRLTRLGHRHYPENIERACLPFGRTYVWLGLGPIRSEDSDGTDTAAIARGDASVTLLAIDQTLPEARAAFPALAERLERAAKPVRKEGRRR